MPELNEMLAAMPDEELRAEHDRLAHAASHHQKQY